MTNNDRLAETIAEQLTRSILVEKRWKPNERLPTERQLAEHFHVGRSSVREAVKSLATNGVLVVRRGSGIYVAERPGLLPDPLNFAEIRNIDSMLREWYQVRMILESAAMRMVVQAATAAEIQQICALADKEVEMLDRGEKSYMDVDREFHMSLANATHNVIMKKTILSLQQSLYYNLTKEEYIRLEDSHKDNVRRAHPAIAEFVRLRDGAGAEMAMRLHMLHAIETLDKSKLQN